MGDDGETSLNNHRFTHNVVWHIFEFLSSSPVFWWICVADLFSFLCCPIMCLSSVLWCPLRFPHKNNVRFIFTSSCCRRTRVLFTLFVFVCIVSSTYCVVFLFCFSSSLDCPFLIAPSVFSNVFFMYLYRRWWQSW